MLRDTLLNTKLFQQTCYLNLFGTNYPQNIPEVERSGKEPRNLRAPVAKVAASTLTVMVDRWELNKEDQFPISRFNQWAPNPAKAPTREQRASLFARRSPGPAHPHTPRVQSERKLTWSCCKSKPFQYWNIDPALAAILRHIETEWKADRESARGAGVQRERERARERERGGGARAKHGAERIERRGRARNGVIERTPTCDIE